MHDLTLAGSVRDRLLLLYGGRIVADGAPAEVLPEELIAEHYGAQVRVGRRRGDPGSRADRGIAR